MLMTFYIMLLMTILIVQLHIYKMISINCHNGLKITNSQLILIKLFLFLLAQNKDYLPLKNYPIYIYIYIYIYIHEYLLPWKNECKYVGVIIDSNLTCHSHINFICSKLRPKLGLLTRLRHILSRKDLCLIYITLIQSGDRGAVLTITVKRKSGVTDVMKKIIL